VRNLKGLQDVIALSVTHPTWQRTRPDQDEHSGWAFASPGDEPFANPLGYGSFPPKDVIPDPVNNATFVRDLYEMTGNDPGVC
jgi:glutathionyl-hydroquinone reductase